MIDVIRKKLEFNDLVKAVEAAARDHNASAILVEDTGAGVQYIQQRSGLAPCAVIPVSTGNKSKEFRFDGVTPMIEGGLVYLPRKASWLKDYEAELLAFPNSAADDQVDSTSQYLNWARRRGSYGTRKMKTGRRRR